MIRLSSLSLLAIKELSAVGASHGSLSSGSIYVSKEANVMFLASPYTSFFPPEGNGLGRRSLRLDLRPEYSPAIMKLVGEIIKKKKVINFFAKREDILSDEIFATLVVIINLFLNKGYVGFFPCYKILENFVEGISNPLKGNILKMIDPKGNFNVKRFLDFRVPSSPPIPALSLLYSPETAPEMWLTSSDFKKYEQSDASVLIAQAMEEES